ncbi:MAG: KAP family P-loop NTPase fold protein [Acidithiobacillus sp.]
MTTNDTDAHPALIPIISDLPEDDPARDAYGYAPFAKLIAEAIRTTPSPHGLVMAVHGPWGSGKSTLLNFVKHYLSMAGDNAPVVIEFNPWWFDDRKHLAAQFLAKFKSNLSIESEALRKIGYVMADYAEALGKVVAAGYGIPYLDKPVEFLLKLFRRTPPGDIPKLKAEISNALKAEGRRFLFVVDDIDRLTPDEMRELFKVIKALADFPNVIYILAFDRKIVANALAVSLKVNGDEYLEKIVQIPFDLPSVDPDKLRDKLFAGLNLVLQGTEVALFDQTLFGNVFVEGILPSVTKPRDVLRYVNAVSVTFMPVRNEVNPVDFLALEFVRLRFPDLYGTIRGNSELFAGYSDRGITAAERREEREFHDRWIAKLPQDILDGVRSMMERIFPRLSNMGHQAEILTEWSRNLRAAHPDVFPAYFRFAINEDRLSRRTMRLFVLGMDDVDATAKILLAAAKERMSDGTSKARAYLDRLQDFEEDLNEDRAANLLMVLGRIGDSLFIPEDETGGFITIRNSWRLMWAMQRALGRLPEGRRDALLIASAKDGEALTYLCDAIHVLESAQEKPVDHGPAAPLSRMGKGTVAELKGIALDRIRRFAEEDHLADAPELPSVLIKWKDWAGAEEVRTWMTEAAKDIHRLFRVLDKFMTHVKSQSMGDSVGRERPTLGLKLLAEFADLEAVANALSGLQTEAAIHPRQALILDTFAKQYGVFKEGKDPDSPWAVMGM